MDNNYINIKELNLEIINPSTRDYMNPESYGSKIVVIGKPGCFTRNTEIMMFDGTSKFVQDVKVGDKVMGDDSTARNVLELCNNSDEMYKIKPKFGESYTVNKQHKLVLKLCNNSLDNYKKNDILEITVENYLRKENIWKSCWCIFRNVVNFQDSPTDLDPYLYGLCISNSNNDFYDHSKILDFYKSKKNITEESQELYLNKIKEILSQEHNSIHKSYKINSLEKRLELLAGILDSNSILNTQSKSYEILINSPSVSNDICFLARSCGFNAVNKKIIKLGLQNFENNYKISIFGDIKLIPCLNENHLNLTYENNRNNLISKFFTIPMGVDEYFGFTLDGNHRFLLNSCDVVRNTGKSTLISSILYHKKHIFPTGLVMSGSEDSNGFYKQFIPPIFVLNDYNEEKIKDFVKRQKISREHLENPWGVLLLDDCTDDNRIFNTPLQQGLYKKGRHWKMLYILSLQYAMDVKPSIRTNVDGVFILREPILKNRKAVWENYASIVPDFNTFCQLMDNLTGNYTSLFINNAAKTNDWQDCVFYYKAKIPPPNFKFGSSQIWDFNEARYNKFYTEKY